MCFNITELRCQVLGLFVVIDQGISYALAGRSPGQLTILPHGECVIRPCLAKPLFFPT